MIFQFASTMSLNASFWTSFTSFQDALLISLHVIKPLCRNTDWWFPALNNNFALQNVLNLSYHEIAKAFCFEATAVVALSLDYHSMFIPIHVTPSFR